MYRAGHYGVALLAYAPVGYVLADEPRLAVVGGAITLALTGLPDIDHRLPLVAHRGITHTVAFAVVVAAVTGTGGWIAATRRPVAAALAPPPVLGTLAGGAGGLAILTHLVADVLTPMGIRPLRPLSDRRYSLGLVRAANPVANYLLLVLGLVAVGVVATSVR